MILILVPMPIEEQVASVYTGVRGFLDKMDPAKIGDFEQQFLSHIKSSHQDVLKTIATEGKITDATEAKLKSIVTDFMASYQD